MQRRGAIAIGCGLLFLTAAGCTNNTTSQSEGLGGKVVTVPIPPGASGKGPSAYGANPLTITKGTTVLWVNHDTMAHTATSDTGVFSSGKLEQGVSYSYRFDAPGNYPYHDDLYGEQSMSGVVVVQ